MQAWAWARASAPHKRACEQAGRLALFALCVLAIGHVYEGFGYALQYSQDFQWSPSALLIGGRDPFAWYLAGNADGRIILSQEPNYLQLLYEVLAPLAFLSWPAAKAAWVCCNVAMGLSCAYMLTRDAGLRGAWRVGAIATFVAATPFAHTLGNGQQSLLCLFALTLAWRKKAQSAGGFWLALGAAKYSFAPPIALWMLLDRRLSSVAVAAFVSLLAVAVFVVATGAEPLVAALEPFHVSALATRVGLADVMSFARSLDLEPSTANAVAYFGSVGAAGLGVLVMWRTRRGLEDGDIFAYLCALSLFAFFHNLYDYVLLAPLFFRSFRYPALPRAIAIGYVCFFWFGVKFAEPWLKSSAAIGAMTLASAAVFLLLVCRGAGDPESALSDDAAVALGPSGVTPLRDAALTAA